MQRILPFITAIVSLLAAAEATARPQLELYAMDCGRFSFADTDFYADDGSFKGVRGEMVNPCYLIRHGSDHLLWDLGMPDSLAESRADLTPREGIVLSMPKSLVSQLAELQLTPADVDFIAISHSHFDHIGNGALFRRATFVLDEREHAFLFKAEERAQSLRIMGVHGAALNKSYSALEQSKTVKIKHGEPHDFFGDQSVVMYSAPGHTPGHRMLLVRLPEAGAILLTGDMYHLAQSRERRTIPRRNDRAQTLASFEVVEKLAADNKARVIRQHVPEDFTSLPAFPKSLR
jgi:N-acyl homoserine lactone hydrolase